MHAISQHALNHPIVSAALLRVCTDVYLDFLAVPAGIETRTPDGKGRLERFKGKGRPKKGVNLEQVVEEMAKAADAEDPSTAAKAVWDLSWRTRNQTDDALCRSELFGVLSSRPEISMCGPEFLETLRYATGTLEVRKLLDIAAQLESADQWVSDEANVERVRADDDFVSAEGLRFATMIERVRVKAVGGVEVHCVEEREMREAIDQHRDRLLLTYHGLGLAILDDEDEAYAYDSEEGGWDMEEEGGEKGGKERSGEGGGEGGMDGVAGAGQRGMGGGGEHALSKRRLK